MAKSELRTKIAQLRAMSGISARDFAALSGRSFHTQKALESGRLALSEDLARTLARKTGVSLDWFLDHAVTGPPVDWEGKELTQRHVQANIGASIARSTEVTEQTREMGFRILEQALSGEDLESPEQEKARAGWLAIPFLRNRFEDILENARTRSDFDLCVFRATQFLNSMEKEFPPPPRDSGSSQSRP
jgi:transcriptional regulator with XRE-family HTH domain